MKLTNKLSIAAISIATVLASASLFAAEETLISSPVSNYKTYSNYPVVESTGDSYSKFIERVLSPLYVPNDPAYKDQRHWLPATNSDGFIGTNNILSSVQRLTPLRKPVIAYIDSGFYDHPDIVYRDGYSFTTRGRQEVGENFFIQDEYNTPELRSYNCTVHGSAVAGIGGATRDNGLAIAGVSDADVVAVRAMYCGNGYLNEVFDSINWALGNSIDGSRLPEVDIDVINLSLGGQKPSCEVEHQAIFDEANKKGIPLVIAVGNDQVDVAGFSPANCKGGIVVAAATIHGDLSPVSNYGEGIDIVALGDGIPSFIEVEDEIGYWDESSVATPIVSGTIANAISELGKFTIHELKFFLSATASAFAAGQCDDSLRCGAGILDAGDFIDSLRDYRTGNMLTLKSALGNAQLCDKSLYITDNDELARLCETYEVELPTIKSSRDDVRYEILEFPKGSPLAFENGSVFTTIDSSRLLISSLDFDTKDYGVRLCNDERCYGEEAIKISKSQEDAPAICND